jgi:hypothetical protein
MNPTAPLSWTLWFLGEVAFNWIPGAVVSITGSAPQAANIPPPTIITEPVTATQVVDYLQTASAPGVYDALFREWSSFVAFSILFTLGFSAVIIYCCVRVFQVRQMERRRYAAMQNPVKAHDVPKTQLRWSRIKEEANSDNERSWRLAILEADIMLNELLDSLGYKGETMADKMRGAEKANFNTLDLAWEAHRYRNQIAHEANLHLLTQREVRRIISLYERVFREFRFVD